MFHELSRNDDDDQYKLAQSVLAGRYAFFEHDVVDPAGDGPMIPEHEPAAAEKLEDELQAGAARS